MPFSMFGAWTLRWKRLVGQFLTITKSNFLAGDLSELD